MTEQFANNAATTLSAAIESTDDTSISVTSAAGFPESGNFRILIDDEILLVTAVDGTTWTVTRGAESTAGTTHLSGAAVTHVLTAGALGALKDDAGDGDAIHDNVAGEIHAIAEKETPEDDDEVLIEDSSSGYVKKRVKISNLPAGSGVPFATDALFCCHFDGPEPFATDYTLNTTGHRGQEATRTGGVIGRPGRFGKAVQVAEATTNLIANPSVESSDMTGWTTGSTSTLTRTSEAAYIGQYSLKVERTTQTHVQAVYGPIDITNQTYAFSCYAKNKDVPTGGSVQLMLYWSGGAQPGDGTMITVGTVPAPEDGWKRYSLTGSPDYADRTSVRAYLRFNGADTSGQGYYTDCWQLEAKASPTPYCDGSLGAGHTWTGTAHASSSTRAAAHLAYTASDLVALSGGTMMAWVYTEALTGADRYVCRCSPGTGGIILQGASNNTYAGYWGTYPISLGAIVPGIWTHLALTRDTTGTLRSYRDGQQVHQLPAGDIAGTLATMYVGRSTSNAWWWNGLIDDLVILDRGLSAAEVRAVYESNAPLAVPEPAGYTLTRERLLTLQNGETARLGHQAVLNGFVWINNASNVYMAMYLCRGNLNTTQAVFDFELQFSPTKDTANKTNIYWSGSQYEIQNLTGGTKTYAIQTVTSS